MAWSHGLAVQLSGLDIGAHPAKFQNGLASTNQGSLARVWRVQFSYTQYRYSKLTSLFTFHLEIILQPKAYHSKKSINTG